MLKVSERLAEEVEQSKRELDGFGLDLRVAAPGIIRSVDYARQTCTVQLAIRERMNRGGVLAWAEIPILPDVPFFVYSGGGYCLTLPIQPDDDCLVVFGDNCMDAWWQNGGVQNQVEKPHVVSGYSGGAAQMRNTAGDAYIEISGSSINIRAAGGVHIDGGTTIDGRSFLGHTHGGVQPGGGTTGGVS